MTVLSRSWLWPRTTTALMVAENYALAYDMSVAKLWCGRRSGWVWPTWLLSDADLVGQVAW